MNRRTIVWTALLAAVSWGAAAAQGASEAYGTITDRDGNPVEGVVVTFRPQGNPSLAYKGDTNKKGKYFVPGLFTPKEDDMWRVTVESEDHVPIHVVVESRNVNKVLVGDILEAKLPYGAEVPEIAIRPLGRVRVDFTVAPKAEMLMQVPQAEADQAVATPEAAAAAAQPDPWVEALTLAQKGDLDAALPLLEEAITAAPEDAERHAAHAKVLYELARYGDAERAAARAIELAPERTDAREVLASCQMERGDMEGARATVEAALEVAPGNVDLLERKAFVLGQLGDGAGAIAAYEEITSRDAKNVNAWLALAGLYAEAGDVAKSEKAFKLVADLNPADAYQTFYNLGVLIMNRADRTEADTQNAIGAFRKAVEIKPDYGPAYQQLAFALLGVDDRKGALAALEDYVRVAPKAADAARMKSLIETLKKTP